MPGWMHAVPEIMCRSIRSQGPRINIFSGANIPIYLCCRGGPLFDIALILEGTSNLIMPKTTEPESTTMAVAICIYLVICIAINVVKGLHSSIDGTKYQQCSSFALGFGGFKLLHL